jgi:hypothetical protein
MRVMTHCPTAEKPVQTGHWLRPTELANRADPLTFRCQRCGAVHTCPSSEAWVATQASR